MVTNPSARGVSAPLSPHTIGDGAHDRGKDHLREVEDLRKWLLQMGWKRNQIPNAPTCKTTKQSSQIWFCWRKMGCPLSHTKKMGWQLFKKVEPVGMKKNHAWMLDFSVNLMICWHQLRNPTLKIDELARFQSIISSFTQKGHVKEREGNRLILVVPFFVRMNLYMLPMPHAPPPAPPLKYLMTNLKKLFGDKQILGHLAAH